MMWPAETEVMVSQLCLDVAERKNKPSGVSLGTSPRDGLVDDAGY